jgi:hypothetical protein
MHTGGLRQGTDCCFRCTVHACTRECCGDWNELRVRAPDYSMFQSPFSPAIEEAPKRIMLISQNPLVYH